MASRRLPWPDAKTRKLIREVEATPLRERKAFLVGKKVGPSFFYNKRKRYLAEHPEFAQELRSNGKQPPTVKLTAALVSFKDADKETKRKLLEQHDQLSQPGKVRFRERHQVKSALLTYYRKAFRKEDAGQNANGAKNTNSVPVVPIPSGSFEEALATLELKREMYNAAYNSIIADLKQQLKH